MVERFSDIIVWTKTLSRIHSSGEPATWRTWVYSDCLIRLDIDLRALRVLALLLTSLSWWLWRRWWLCWLSPLLLIVSLPVISSHLTNSWRRSWIIVRLSSFRLPWRSRFFSLECWLHIALVSSTTLTWTTRSWLSVWGKTILAFFEKPLSLSISPIFFSLAL